MRGYFSGYHLKLTLFFVLAEKFAILWSTTSHWLKTYLPSCSTEFGFWISMQNIVKVYWHRSTPAAFSIVFFFPKSFYRWSYNAIFNLIDRMKGIFQCWFCTSKNQGFHQRAYLSPTHLGYVHVFISLLNNYA